MATIPVLVKKDHIEALVATKSPIVSVAELLWNGFDADADTISVRFEHNGLGGLDRIRVQDNGNGFSYDDAIELFGNLGGSWKSEKRRTAKGRSLHGKSGKGRFRAFALGSIVEWKTRSERNNKLVSFMVKGSSSNLETFELGDPKEIENGSTGTEVIISNIHKDFTSLTNDDVVVELKRPSKKIDDAVIGQIKSYAIAVAQDERFRDTKTRWIFWVISNEMTDEARRDARQRGRAEGIVFDDSELNITVLAKTWGQLIQECKGRLQFFKKQLDYEADRESAKDYLQKAHEKYLPTAVKPTAENPVATTPADAEAK